MSSTVEQFLRACEDGSLDKSATEKLGAEIDSARRKKGLQHAASKGHLRSVQALLDVEPTIEVDATTASCGASGGLETFRLLHRRHPDMVMWQSDAHGSVVHTAIRDLNTELLEYLLENGADPGRDPETCSYRFYRTTPLDETVLVDWEEGAKTLVKYGATFEGCEALQEAAAMGRLNMVRCLLKLGLHANGIVGLDSPQWDRCFSCTGPLHAAVKGGYVDVIDILLANGADTHRKDVSGKTAVDIAKEAGHPLVMLALGPSD